MLLSKERATTANLDALRLALRRDLAQVRKQIAQVEQERASLEERITKLQRGSRQAA
jgi:cell division protein FtsB